MNSRIIPSACIRSALKLNKFKVNNSLSTAAASFESIQHSNLKRSLSRINLQNNLPSYDFLTRNLHTKLPKTPDLIYIPHVLRWLKTKFRFKMLQKTWDPEFTEGSFIYGTSRAICRITEIIHDNKPEQLKGLLTTSALIKLRDDISTKLSKMQKLIIRIKPEDIKILVPVKVSLDRDGEYKKCKVAMRVLALKWIRQGNGTLRLVLVALQTEFLRDYTHGTASDWTISAFDILECTVLAKSWLKNRKFIKKWKSCNINKWNKQNLKINVTNPLFVFSLVC